MHSEDTKILEFNQYQKSDKGAFPIYAHLECLIGKINGYENNPESPSTSKVGEKISSDFLMYAISSFKNWK